MEENSILETKYWDIVLADNQYYLGRCTIWLKRQCRDLAELTSEEWLDLHEVIKRLENALKKAFDATMFNITCLMNHAYKEKNPKPQVHWHFMARYNHKVEFAELIFEDKEFGDHYNRKPREVSKEVQTKIIKEIKRFI